MGQIVTNKTQRKTIIHKGLRPEIKILAQNDDEGFFYETKLDINPDHKFNGDYKISIQAYEKNGIALPPKDMGTIGEPSDLSRVFVRDIHIDRVLFRLRVYDQKNILRGLADKISLDDESDENKKELKHQATSDTWLLVKETNNISVPFQVEMEEDELPVLLLKAGLNLKEKFKNNIIVKTLIYTAVIKEILINYLTNMEFNNDSIKPDFINKIILNSGNKLDVPDKKDVLDEEGRFTEQGQNWINEAVSACINKTIDIKGSKVSIMKHFSNSINKEEEIRDEDEN